MSGKSHNKSVGYLWLGVTLAVGFVVSAMILSSALKAIKSNEQVITVKGYAEKNIESDLGVWTGYISVTGIDLVSSYQKLQNDVNILLDYLKDKNIDDSDIKLGAITNYKNYQYTADGRRTSVITGYTLERSVTVTSKDVRLIERLASESTSLIQKGLQISSSLPQYFYTKLNDLKIEMLGKATKDAKERAKVIAENSGNEVGTIKSARQGVFQITARNSADVSDWGEYNLTSINKTIKAVVTASFVIK
jgi:hypothetical protein